jgi:cystathionine beta-lyase
MRDITQLAALMPEAARRHVKGYIVTGDKDQFYQWVCLLHDAMKASGLSCELDVREGMGHRFPPDFGTTLPRALDFVLAHERTQTGAAASTGHRIQRRRYAMRYDFDSAIDRSPSDSVKWARGVFRYGGEGIIPLWVADMDFLSPQPVVEALKARAAYPVYGYSYVSMSLCDAIAERMDRKHGWKVKRDWLCFTPGVVPALKAVVRTFVRPGEGVIVQPPVYPPFTTSVTGNECRLVYNPLKYEEGTYRIDFDDLGSKLSDPGVRMLMLCSPHNPVGRVWSREELARLGEMAVRSGVIVLSDEIHSELVLGGRLHTPFAGISPEFEGDSITCVSPSKMFNLSGLSAAVVVIPDPDLRKRYMEATDGTMGDINVFGLRAMEVAYREGDEWLEQVLDYIRGNVEFLLRFFEDRVPAIRPVPPEGTYLVWLDCRGLGVSSSTLDRIFQEAGVGLMSGADFGPGGEGFMRINVACPRRLLEEGLRRIERAVAASRSIPKDL